VNLSQKFSLVLVVAMVCGCQSGQFLDPNNPISSVGHQGHILDKDLKAASESINERLSIGAISSQQGADELTKYARKLLDSDKDPRIARSEAWEYADVLITAQRWAEADRVLRVALQNPTGEGRKVNDTLRLAHCEAELGDVESAIAITRSSFGATPHWKWPILYATYLEIVPAALAHSKGKELELADLVKDAIHQHERALGDINNKSEKMWVVTRRIQIDRAYHYMEQIYGSIDRPDLVKQTIAASKQQIEPLTAV